MERFFVLGPPTPIPVVLLNKEGVSTMILGVGVGPEVPPWVDSLKDPKLFRYPYLPEVAGWVLCYHFRVLLVYPQGDVSQGRL